ncbi:hypothetical protein [Streptomyces chryseus]|uniref:hypothetical protein n=1 Tax=Streptomyces chryseus TaxID=68186 RepID=UPI00142EDBB7|nr:hypothetical protein [Streptomyces chryseus]GGX26836.1 hypothetical protein GCM10010353_47460 [Streptomyces chryseus]
MSELTDAELDALYDALQERMDYERHYPTEFTDEEREGLSSVCGKTHDEMKRRRLIS